jgi:hypothetical protein
VTGGPSASYSLVMKKRAIVAGVFVAAGVATAVFAAAPATSGGGPFALQPGGEAGGYPLGGSGPSGMQITFIERAGFQIGVLLKNVSKERLTIVSAQTPEPVGGLAIQVGAAFAHYTPCSGSVACPWLGDPRHPTSPKPLEVAPGHDVAVKLSYRLVSCVQAASATTASGNTLVVSFRLAGGRPQQQSFPIGGDKLLLERPVGEACVPRPYSYIGFVGSFNTSPQHQTLPGSVGDTCSLSVARGLSFTSRRFFDRLQTVFRVEIQLPEFDGAGSYGVATGTRVLGRARVTVIGAFGNTSYTTFVDTHGTVTVTKAAPPLYGGRFQAVLAGHHRFFRAYGSWRCTTNY